MLIAAFVLDYDGTLAKDSRVDAGTVRALNALKRSGRKLLLVTGRELPDLRRAFPELGIIDVVVAENGALLFLPSSGEARLRIKGLGELANVGTNAAVTNAVYHATGIRIRQFPIRLQKYCSITPVFSCEDVSPRLARGTHRGSRRSDRGRVR